MGRRHISAAFVSSVALCAIAITSPAYAQNRPFDVKAQPAATGIPELARQADIQILVSESATRGIRIKAVRGIMTIEQALRRATSGTGLHASSSDGRTFTLAPATGAVELPSGIASGSLQSDSDIIVTGSRIRGAAVAAPVITLSENSIRNAGQATLGEVVRSIRRVSAAASSLASVITCPPPTASMLVAGHRSTSAGLAAMRH
jgi:iron complex outermembrane receptor protein